MPRGAKTGWIEKRRGHFYFAVKIGGRKYLRSTGKTTQREADGERERCHQEILADIEAARQATIRTDGRALETFGEAVNFYWVNIGQYHDGGTPDKMSTGSANTFWSLSWLKETIGATTRLEAIDGGVVQQVKARRRGETAKNSTRPVSPATVNRSALQPLRKVLLHAAEFGHARIAKIRWREVLMAEPQERVRELDGDEEIRLFAELRPDYQPLVDVAIILGLRQAESILKLRWHHIGWGGHTITVPGKGGRTDVMQLPRAAKDILWALRAEVSPSSEDELVFSYISQRDRHEDKRVLVKGARYPITKAGLRREFTRAVAAAGLIDFRYHDLRHTFATRMLRAGGNLKQVQRQLRHRQIETTLKYAHVLDHEMREAMDAAASASPRRALDGNDAGGDARIDAGKGHQKGHQTQREEKYHKKIKTIGAP